MSGPSIRSKKLRLRRRREDPLGTRSLSSPPSLFARLPPSVVDALSRDTPYASGRNPPVEFLPLSVRFEDGVTIYVSYNGGDVSESEGKIDL